MSGTATSDSDTTEWVRRVGALTVAAPAGCAVDEIAAATAAAERLAVHAHALLTFHVVPAEPCTGACSGCAEGTCELVRALVAAFPLPLGEGQPVVHRADEALGGYREALADVGTAVFTCRRTLHASGHCLFGETTEDLCGRVLAAAHRQG